MTRSRGWNLRLAGVYQRSRRPAEQPISNADQAINGFRIARIACWIALGALVVVILRTAWVSDDAYITLRTIDNFVGGHGLRWNIAERVQTFTHPLWLLLLTPFYFVTREPFYTTILLSIGISFSAVLILVRSRAADPWAGLVMILALLFSKSFIDYSTSGLENPLTHLMLAVFVVLLPREKPSDRGLLLLALSAGLGMLTRIDNVLLFAPALAVVLLRYRSRRAIAICALGLTPLLAWHLFSLVYYGLPYPNTALAKLNTGIPSGELVGQGLAYLANSLRLDPLTLAVVAGGVVAALGRRRALSIALAAGVLLHLAYVVRIGGDFMSGRFLSAPLFLGVALLGRIEWGKMRGRAVVTLAVIAGLGFLAPYPTSLSGSDYGTRMAEAVDSSGIADERRYYFSYSGWINGRPGPRPGATEEWRAGTELREAGVRLTVDGAVGQLGYVAGPLVHIVDFHALGDPLLSRLPMVLSDPFYAEFRREFQLRDDRSWRIGHFLRSVPDGYLETLAVGNNTIEDPAVSRLYDDVRLITRGEIWNRERLGTLLRLLLRGLPEISHRPRADYTPVPWDEWVRSRPDSSEARYMRSLARRSSGDLAGALLDSRRAIDLHPGHSRAITLAASVLRLAGAEQEALEMTDRGLEIAPDSAALWRARARLFSDRREHREAIDACLKAAELDPRISADALTNAGLEYAKLGDAGQALELLDRAEKRDPRYAITSRVRGRVLMLQNRRDEAQAAFERALVLDPAFEDAALDLARIHATNGDTASALDLLERFAAANEPGAELLFRLGGWLAVEGRREEALAKWEAAARLGHPLAREALRSARDPG